MGTSLITPNSNTKANTKKNIKKLRERTNMKIMLLLTACFATTLIAIPINTDDDDVSSITDGIKDLGQPLTIGQSDIADQEEVKLLSRERRRVKNRNRNGRRSKKSKRKDRKRKEKKRLRSRELAKKDRRELSSYRKLRGFNRFRPRHEAEANTERLKRNTAMGNVASTLNMGGCFGDSIAMLDITSFNCNHGLGGF